MTKIFLRIIRNKLLKICENWYLLMEKIKKITRNKRTGDSILQTFITQTLKTWKTSPNSVKNSKKYPLLTLMSYFDTSFTVHSFIKSSVAWCPSYACAVFPSRTSIKIVNFCFQYHENFSNTMMLLVFLNIILWH